MSSFALLKTLFSSSSDQAELKTLGAFVANAENGTLDKELTELKTTASKVNNSSYFGVFKNGVDQNHGLYKDLFDKVLQSNAKSYTEIELNEMNRSFTGLVSTYRDRQMSVLNQVSMRKFGTFVRYGFKLVK